MQSFNKRKMMIYIMIIIFFIVVDRFLKFLAVNNYLNRINLIGDFFKLDFVKNYNIAFSLPLSGLFLNILISLIIISLIYYLINLLSKKLYLQSVFLSAVILGAISNLFDRFKYGYVVDYLDLKYFTVFNLADAMIVLGVIGLGWIVIRVDKNKEIV